MMKENNEYAKFTLTELEKMQDIRRKEIIAYLDLIQSTFDEEALNFFSTCAGSAKSELVLLRKEILRRDEDSCCEVKWVEDEGCGIKNDK